MNSDDFWELCSQTHRVQIQTEALVFHLAIPNPHAFELAAQGRDPVWGLSHTFQHKTPPGWPLIRLRRGPWVERPKPFPEREREKFIDFVSFTLVLPSQEGVRAHHSAGLST